jgi:cobalt-zinc-cadmium efflux system membrane fusion protein
MNYRNITPVALAGAAAVAGLLVGRLLGPHSAPGVAPPPTQAAAAPKSVGSSPPPATDVVTLTAAQAKAVSTAPVGTHTFVDLRTAVGMIDFDQNTMVPALSNYAGKIIKVWVDVGDSVKAGQVLYSVDSADLLQAETALVAAAGTYQVTTAALERATALHATGGFSQKDLDQALADQHTADTALQAARATVRVFGKSEQEIDRVVKTRKADSALLVLSPVSGRVIMRAAQPGLYVQAAGLPAPIVVADVATVWLLATVPESDSLSFKVGQPVAARLSAYPERTFRGVVSVVGETVDPSSHTVLVRSVIADPNHTLKAGMLATFEISAGAPMASLAVPVDGIVREGDGTMSAWVTNDRLHYSHRIVKLGLQQDGYHQVLEGVAPGETIVTKGAILLSNLLYGSAQH